MGFWFFGLVLSVVFGVLRRIGWFVLLFCLSVGLGGSSSQASDFITLPPGIDWSSVFIDLVALITPLVIFSVGFGAYRIVAKCLNQVRGR